MADNSTITDRWVLAYTASHLSTHTSERKLAEDWRSLAKVLHGMNERGELSVRPAAKRVELEPRPPFVVADYAAYETRRRFAEIEEWAKTRPWYRDEPMRASEMRADAATRGDSEGATPDARPFPARALRDAPWDISALVEGQP